MTVDECAIALQLYRDGALQRQITAELGREASIIGRVVYGAGLKRGHRFRTRGPRAYLVDRLMPVVHVPSPCDCQLPPGIVPDFAAVSVSCPFHGDG